MRKVKRDERGSSEAVLPVSVFLLTLILVLAAPPNARCVVKPDEKITSLSAKTIEGEEIKIDFSSESSPVILTFWSIYCKSCSEELEKVQALVEKYGFDRVRIYAVNEDYDLRVERVSRFLRNLEKRIGKIKFNVLYDEGAKMFNFFTLLHMPTLIYIDGGGEVREVIEGFDRGRQRAVISALSKLLEEVAPEKLKEVEEEKYFEVETRVPICGIYRNGKWVRPVDDSREEQEKSVERAFSTAEYLGSREAIRMALEDVGMKLFFLKKEPSCLKPHGIEPEMYLGKKDALDLFLETFNTRNFFALEESKRREDERFALMYSIYKANLRKLRDSVIQRGYSPRASTYVLKFVNADFFNHSEFIDKLLRQVPLVRHVKTISRDGQLMEDELSCHIGNSDNLTRALEGVNMERERISATSLGGNIIEIQFLR